MRRTFFLLLMLFGISRVSHGQWKQVSAFPGEIRVIYFLDDVGHPEIGFAGLFDGQLWRTSDKGITWQQSSIVAGGISIADIVFKDMLTGWCVLKVSRLSGFSLVFQTTDGGLNWSSQLQSTQSSGFSAIYYLKAQNRLFVSDWDGGGFSSDDDGVTWNNFNTSLILNGYAFSDKLNGIATFALANPNSLLQTTDGGSTWNILQVPVQATPAWQPAVKPGSSSFFIFSEYDGVLTRSDDNGLTWRAINTISVPPGPSPFPFTGCLRISGCSEFFVQSTSDGLFSSRDDGLTWTKIGGPSNDNDTRFCTVGSDVYAADFNGGLWTFHSDLGNSTLNLPANSLHLQSADCDTISAEFQLQSMSCNPGIDTIVAATINGSNFFSVSSAEIMPRTYKKNDSIRILYHRSGNANDTASLSLHVLIGGKEIDTVITLFGLSLLSRTTFEPQIDIQGGSKLVSIRSGRDTIINFSVSADIPSVSAFDSLTFDLHFDPNMLKLNSADAPGGWNIAIREIQSGWWNCWFYNSSHSDIAANQALAHFHFSSYLTTDTVSEVLLKAGNAFFDPLKHIGCAVAALPQDDSVLIQANDICADKTLREFLATGNIDARIISIRPNPARNEIAVETESTSLCQVNVAIYDDLGRNYFNEMHLIQGKTTLDLSIGSLSAGTYHIMLKSASGSVSSEFVKLQ